MCLLAPPQPPGNSGSQSPADGSSPTLTSTSVNAEMDVADKFSGRKGAIEETQHARDLLSQLSAVCVGCSTELLTLNALADDLTRRGHAADGSLPPTWLAGKILISHTMGLAFRAPYLIPIFGLHIIPYGLATYCSAKYASHEEESMASAKALV